MVKIWDLKTAVRDGYLVFKSSNPRIHVPYEPCLGIIGLAPDPYPTFPLSSSSEDEDDAIDIKYLTPGSTISLPVKRRGALLTIADAHATRSPAEACGTSVEMAAKVRIRVTVEKNTKPFPFTFISVPAITITPAANEPVETKFSEETHYSFCGLDHTLREATDVALSGLVHRVSDERGLSRREAYMLFGAVGRLRRLDDPEDDEEGFCEVESVLPFGVFV
ncbi:uncharacterized protein GGS22DRAFT_168664 [Annulohypoxylon maeteangense]|uniref:uncharacterized protein n=1 Tax=Annulohypoxylon maeteangense TaxID=1927788 RepID=UPI002007492A|nr:uncharacterized protein GGS22DRAFT_168664 [Annulohypoxylon maeteangense]KAI0882762.1 hypothetical protein GGS22DRAFT_168664 [Annulohypoxylon maeteangense]